MVPIELTLTNCFQLNIKSSIMTKFIGLILLLMGAMLLS